MSCSFLDLLVQSEHSMVRDNKMKNDLITFISFVMKNLINVISLFYIEKKFELIDPHVGDTACQIRACFIAVFANAIADNSPYLKRMKQISELHIKLLEFKEKSKKTQAQEKNNNSTLRELVDQIDVHFTISEEEKILFQSYFLTAFKTNGGKETIVIDFDRISQHLSLSRKSAKKLTRHYQLSVASFSCKTILQWGLSVLAPNELRLLNGLKRFDDDDREVLPCYLFTKVIYHYALKNKIPILVLATVEDRVIPLYFKPNNVVFVYTRPVTSELQKPCIIITGHSKGKAACYGPRFITTGLKSILLSSIAAHPQYTGKKLSPFSQNLLQGISMDETAQNEWVELQYMRLLALILGCSYQNESLFVVNHIYCATIQSQSAYLKANNDALIKEYELDLEYSF